MTVITMPRFSPAVVCGVYDKQCERVMPPKRKTSKATESSTKATEASKASSSGRTSCCVCCQGLNRSKDEVLFCEGSCQQWAHRYCLGVSEMAYKVIREKNYKFRCFACLQIEQQDDIAKLRDEVARLTTLLQSPPSASDSPADLLSDSVDSVAPGPRSYASAAKAGEPRNHLPRQTPRVDYSESRKFNVVIFGLVECPQGTKRHDRLVHDLSMVESVFSDIDVSLKSSSIKDCFRLGRYKPDQVRPRPILVKLIRIEDVSKVLANRRAAKAPIVIKPDMTRDERTRESILLKHRWDLINSGIPKQAIRISKSKIFIDKVEYGCITESGFRLTGDKPNTLSSSSSSDMTPNNNSDPDTISSVTSLTSLSVPAVLPLTTVQHPDVSNAHNSHSAQPATSPTSLSVPAVLPETTVQHPDVSNAHNSHSARPGELPTSGNVTLTPSSEHSLASSPE